MTFGKPKKPTKRSGMTLGQVNEVKEILNLIPDATSIIDYGAIGRVQVAKTDPLKAGRLRKGAEALLREAGPDALRDYLYTNRLPDNEIKVIEDLCRERGIYVSPVDADLWRERRRREQAKRMEDPIKKKARQQRRHAMRKAENNEHRTPRRSNPTVARPVLSRTSGTNSAGIGSTYQGLIEQGFRRRSEVERAVRSSAREGYGVFYPGHPSLRGHSSRGEY